MAVKGVHYTEAAAPAGVRLYAIGDVHGRLDLLQAMLSRIDAEVEIDRPADWRIILLGDYVDRGPDLCGVLAQLSARKRDDPHFIALAGNHDASFLEFLDKPDAGGLFMQFGGIQTAQSYGVTLKRPYRHGIEEADRGFLESSAQFQQAVPPDHVEFLRKLPRGCFAGDFFFCHAGIRPRVPLEKQSASDLIWIRNDFLLYADLHPKVIVHGHTPVEQPDIRDNRVNVDTKAYEFGVLTAFVVDGTQKRFLTIGNGF